MSVRSFWTALLVALVLGIVNAIIRPIFVILTLPLTVVTLGLFLFVNQCVADPARRAPWCSRF